MSTSSNAIRRVTAGLLAAFLAIFLIPGLALGHAELETATPADGSTVTEPVTEVVGTYGAAMDPDRSKLTVEDANGNVVAQGGVDPDDDTRMVAIPETPLGDGDYRVKSAAWATDGDLERETWNFTVALAASPPPTTTPTPTATPAPTRIPTDGPGASATSTPVPSPSGEGTASGSSSDVILPIVVVLVVLGVGAAFLLNRRNRPADPA